MKKPFLYLVIMVCSISATSQNLDQKLISTAGGHGSHSNGKSFSYSIGEPLVELGVSDSSILSQGFQQWFKGLEIEYFVSNTSCPVSNDGSITFFNISDCTIPYTVVVNGQSFSDTVLTGFSPGIYDVSFTSSTCSQNFQITIEEGTGSCSLIFYNGFTPNEDGTNDSWIIENITAEDYLSNEIEIYNRLGVLVWKGSNYDNSNVVFTGIDQNGNTLPDATYFYFAKMNEQEYSGFIELLR